MINDFVRKGIVANIWGFAVALLFRLACYRHPDLLPKPLNELQDAADFVAVQVPQSILCEWVHGFLHSRDYEESMVDFIKNNRGADLPVPDTLGPSELRAPCGSKEMVARRTMSQVIGSRW